MSLTRRKATTTVGRDTERATIGDRLGLALRGHGNVVLLIGDAGIGKSRLLEGLAAKASRCGALILRGRGSEIAGLPPYLLFLEALAPYIRVTPTTVLQRQLGSSGVVLGELIPGLGEHRVRRRAALLSPEDARLRLFDSMAQFLSAIALKQPLVLLFDNLHWADSASLDMLCHIGCHYPLGRILIAGALRAGEATANAALSRLIDQFNRDRLLTALRLAPLGSEEIANLAAGLLNGAIDCTLQRSLYEQSEGNPFFAEELLQCWRESGDVVMRAGSWTLASNFAGNRIPPGIRGTVQQRLARLPKDVAKCLDIASLIGRTFEPEMIATVANAPVEVIEGMLMTACQSGLVHSDEGGSFWFAHDKIRECVLVGIPASRRRRWHCAIGDAIEMRANHSDTSDLAALAFHFARANASEKAVTYALKAADNAIERYAAVAAVEYYRDALRLIGRDDERQMQILLDLGNALMWADDPIEAEKMCKRAYTLAMRAANRLAAARALLRRGQVLLVLRQRRAACELLKESISLLSDESQPEIVHALSCLASIEASLGEHAAGVTHARQAQKQAAILGDPVLEAQACRSLGKLLTRTQMGVSEGAVLIDRALALATAADDPAESAACQFRVAYAALNAGQLSKCLDASLARIDLARRAHDPFQLNHAQSWLAYMTALQGNWREVAHLVTELRPAAKRLVNQEPLSFLLKAEGYSAYQRGDFTAAETAFAAVEEILGDRREGLTQYRGLLGLAQLRAGKFDVARASMEESERFLAVLPPGSVAAGPILACVTSMAMVLSDQPRLSRYYQALLPFSGQYYWFLVDRLLANIELRYGDWRAAGMHLTAADSHASREGMHPELAMLRYARAQLELARGGPGSTTRARLALAAALQGFDALEMTAEGELARERLRELPPQPGQSQRMPLLGGLSSREAQVLALVAAGLSNHQIAQELTLSDHTVANHVTSILNKTGANNRAAAAAFAARHGLVAGNNSDFFLLQSRSKPP